MDDCVFCSCFDAQFLYDVGEKKGGHFVRGRCGKSLKLAVMFGVSNAGQCDLNALSAVVIVFGD